MNLVDLNCVKLVDDDIVYFGRVDEWRMKIEMVYLWMHEVKYDHLDWMNIGEKW